MKLDHGVDVDGVQDKYGNTALDIAVQQGRPAILDFLLSMEARSGAKERDGYTPLHYAAMAGNRATVETLLKHPDRLRGEVNAVHSNFGYTPLHCVANRTMVQETWKLLSAYYTVIEGTFEKKKNKEWRVVNVPEPPIGKMFDMRGTARVLVEAGADFTIQSRSWGL